VPGLLPSSGPSGGALGIYFFVHHFSCHSLNVSFFPQTFVVPEWEPVGTAVFVPLAASERLKKRVIGWKFLPGTSPVASVPGYSLRSLSLDYASHLSLFTCVFYTVHCRSVCLIDYVYSLVCVCGTCEWGFGYMRMGVWVYENAGLGI
jgi:hypothetical protein